MLIFSSLFDATPINKYSPQSVRAVAPVPFVVLPVMLALEMESVLICVNGDVKWNDMLLYVHDV